MAKKVPGTWVTKSGIKYYRIRLDLGNDTRTGKRIYKDFYGKTQKEALQKKEKYEEKVGLNVDHYTLGGFMYNWLWNVKRQSVKPTSFERYEGVYRKYVLPCHALHEAKLEDLSNVFFQRITNELLDETITVKSQVVKKYSVNEITTMNKLIKSCLNYATMTDVLKINPMKKIVYPINYEVEEEAINYISEEKQKKLIDCIRGDEMEDVILTGIFTGMRVSEILGLTPKDIDFKNKIIRVNKMAKSAWTGTWDEKHKKIYEYKVWKPKSEKGTRIIPMSNELIPVFIRAMQRNEENKKKYGDTYYRKHDLLFCTDNGYFIDIKKPNRHLKTALKQAGIEEDIHFHSLRHIFVTNCVYADVNIGSLMTWAGHSDIDMTMNVYAEVNNERSQSEFKKLDDFLK